MRRCRILELKCEGWTHEEIAEALDVSTWAVKKWIQAVRKAGESDLQARPHPGASPRLAGAELALMPKLLAAASEAYGFRGEVWTCARMAVVIE